MIGIWRQRAQNLAARGAGYGTYVSKLPKLLLQAGLPALSVTPTVFPGQSYVSQSSNQPSEIGIPGSRCVPLARHRKGRHVHDGL